MYQPKEPITSARRERRSLGQFFESNCQGIDDVRALESVDRAMPIIVVSSINAAAGNGYPPERRAPEVCEDFSTGIRWRNPTGWKRPRGYASQCSIQVLLSFSSYRNGAKLFA